MRHRFLTSVPRQIFLESNLSPELKEAKVATCVALGIHNNQLRIIGNDPSINKTLKLLKENADAIKQKTKLYNMNFSILKSSVSSSIQIHPNSIWFPHTVTVDDFIDAISVATSKRAEINQDCKRLAQLPSSDQVKNSIEDQRPIVLQKPKAAVKPLVIDIANYPYNSFGLPGPAMLNLWQHIRATVPQVNPLHSEPSVAQAADSKDHSSSGSAEGPNGTTDFSAQSLSDFFGDDIAHDTPVEEEASMAPIRATSGRQRPESRFRVRPREAIKRNRSLSDQANNAENSDNHSTSAKEESKQKSDGEKKTSKKANEDSS